MRFHLAVVLLTAGCNLVNSNNFSVDYAFDPEEYQKSVGNAQGNFPPVACADVNDQCAQAAAALPMGSALSVSCDAMAKQCRATAELRLSYPINLSMQSSFPPEAIQFGINFVDIKKVKYWVASNTLTVGTPAIDLYVAPGSAKDETMGTKLGSVSPLGAKSVVCKDSVDSDDKAGSSMVCDVPLEQAGKDQLAAFAKDYKNEFQIIAHAVITAKGGDPLPSGAIDFVVRPVIDIGIVK